MKKNISVFIVLSLSIIYLNVQAQNFTVGWYEPQRSPMDPGCTQNDFFDAVDGSPSGSFADIGINTLLTYDHGIYQVYNGSA